MLAWNDSFPPLNLFNWPKSMTKWVNITRQELEDIKKDWEQHHMDKIELVKHDPVNHPRHYTNHPSGIECIQITEHMSFTLGNAVKYIWRADLKNGVEDIEKAIWYLQRELAKRKKA